MTSASASSPRLTPQDYLLRERDREEKYEYENGKEIPVGGATKEHNQIVRNLLTSIWNRVGDRGTMEAYASDMRVYCPSISKYYYPDLVITEGKEVYQDDTFDTLTNPVILIEVLSKGTEARDRTVKFEAYRSIESFREYLLVSQDQPRIEGFYKNEKGEWILLDPVEGMDRHFSFQTVELAVPLEEVYQRVKL